MKTLFISFFCTFFCLLALAQTPHYTCSLLKDINPGLGSSPSSDFITSDSLAYWRNYNLDWYASDGTSAGTRKIGNFGYSYSAGIYKNRLLLGSSDTLFVLENGNRTVIDIGSRFLGEYDEKLYFYADSLVYATDGLQRDTIMQIKDVLGLHKSGDKLYWFTQKPFDSVSVFMRTNTTTSLVKKMSDVGYFTTIKTKLYNNTLYFAFSSAFNPDVLWQTDGTTVGTIPIPDYDNYNPNVYINAMDTVNNALWIVSTVKLNGGGARTTLRIKKAGLADRQLPLVTFTSSEHWAYPVHFVRNGKFVYVTKHSDTKVYVGQMNTQTNTMRTLFLGNMTPSMGHSDPIAATDSAFFIQHYRIDAITAAIDTIRRQYYHSFLQGALNNTVFIYAQDPKLGYEIHTVTECPNTASYIKNIVATIDSIPRQTRLEWDFVPNGNTIDSFCVYRSPNNDEWGFQIQTKIPINIGQTHYELLIPADDPAERYFYILAQSDDVCKATSSDISNTVVTLCKYAAPTIELAIDSVRPRLKLTVTIHNPTNTPVDSVHFIKSSGTGYTQILNIPYTAGQTTYTLWDTLLFSKMNMYHAEIFTPKRCSNTYQSLFNDYIPNPYYDDIFAKMKTMRVVPITNSGKNNAQLQIILENEYKMPYDILNLVYTKTNGNCVYDLHLPYNTLADSRYIDTLKFDFIQYQNDSIYFKCSFKNYRTNPWIINTTPKTVRANAPQHFQIQNFTAIVAPNSDCVTLNANFIAYDTLRNFYGGVFTEIQYREEGDTVWRSVSGTAPQFIWCRNANSIAKNVDFKAVVTNNCAIETESQIIKTRPLCDHINAFIKSTGGNYDGFVQPIEEPYAKDYYKLLLYLERSAQIDRFSVARKAQEDSVYQTIADNIALNLVDKTQNWGQLYYDDVTLPGRSDAVDYRIVLLPTATCMHTDTLYLHYSQQPYSMGRIQIAPNPVYNNIVQIFLANPNATAQAVFYNLLGQEVYTAQNIKNYTRLDIPHLQEGYYMMRVSDSDGNVKTFKINKY